MKQRFGWIILLLSLGLIFGLVVAGCGGGGGGGDDDDTDDDDTDDDDTDDDDADVDLTPCQPDFTTGIEPNTVGTNPFDTGATVWVIDNQTCAPISGAYVNFNGEGKNTDANGKATFTLTKAAATVHVLDEDYNFRSYVGVDANTFLVRLNPVAGSEDLDVLDGTFYCPDGDINTLLPQADSVLKIVGQGQRLVAGLALKGLTRDVLASLNFDAIFTGETTITIPAIPPFLPDPIEIDGVPENVWIPELPFGPGSGSIQLDPYSISFYPTIEYQPISGMALSADVKRIVFDLIGLECIMDFENCEYWNLDWPSIISYVNIERVGLERNFKPSDAANADISLSVPVTTGFGSGVPAYPFTVNVSGVPSKVASKVINIAAGEVPYRGISLFWFGMGTSGVTMGAAPADGALKDMQYLVFSAATDMLSSGTPTGNLSVVIKELDQLNAGDTVNVSGFLDYLDWTQNDLEHPTSVGWTPVDGANLAMIIFTLGDYSWLITAPPDAGSFELPGFDPGFDLPAPDSVVLLVTANEGFDYDEFDELELVNSIEAVSTSVENLFAGGCGM